MSDQTKSALIGAIATIIAALIGGMFLLKSVSGSSNSPTSATTNVTATSVATTQTTESQSSTPQPTPPKTQFSTPQPTPQGTHTVDTAGASSKMDSFCNYVNSGALQQAYNLTSSNYQSHNSIGQFTNQFSNSDLIRGGCLHGQPTLSGNNVTLPLTMSKINTNDGSTSSANYIVTLLQDSQSSYWVINSIQLE